MINLCVPTLIPLTVVVGTMVPDILEVIIPEKLSTHLLRRWPKGGKEKLCGKLRPGLPAHRVPRLGLHRFSYYYTF